MDELALSRDIEQLLVARNPRNMALARAALEPGYFLRGASYLRDVSGTIVIGTGFPVAGTFETDGPVGAMALYHALEQLGATPVIACGPPLSKALEEDFRVLELTGQNLDTGRHQASAQLAALQPNAIIAIEQPGVTADGCYYNMRREDITAHCRFFDPFLQHASCPTIAIGDGGNEIGMGNIAVALRNCNIEPSVTGCDELLVADVSNWGAYGLIAWLAYWSRRDLLAEIAPLAYLRYLSSRGSVDGVTGDNTLTEDGLDADEGLHIIAQLRRLTKFTHR